MPNVDVVRDAPGRPQAPVDESVKIPDSVKRATELANSFYVKPAETPAEAQPAEPAAPAPETPPQAVAPPVPESAPVQPAAEPVAQPSKDDLRDSEWAQRYNSMKGRWEQSQRTIGSMQEQMSQLADELMRTQQMITQRQAEPEPAPQKYITPDDVETFGDSFIDVAKRAAQEAVAPELNALRQENQSLKQQVTKSAKMTVAQTLDRDVPNWREVNRNPRFKTWLNLRDIYSGEIRKKLLDVADKAADAPRIVAFFKGFIADEQATGQMEPAPRAEPQVAPRQAAVALETLTAPGRARPASGSATTPAEKPIFTRAQISKFYSDVRAGFYNGRAAEKDRFEQEVFAAQREGRVR